MREAYSLIWSVLVLLFRSRVSLEAEILILRYQLNIQRRHLPKRVAFSAMDRLIFVGLYRLVPNTIKASSVEVAVDFDSSVQSLSALDAAAYRLIGTATCRVDRIGDRYVCRLTPSANPRNGAVLSSDDLKERFLNLVADENLRARVAEKTDGVRNVILALAFGSLAATQNDAG